MNIEEESEGIEIMVEESLINAIAKLQALFEVVALVLSQIFPHEVPATGTITDLVAAALE